PFTQPVLGEQGREETSLRHIATGNLHEEIRGFGIGCGKVAAVEEAGVDEIALLSHQAYRRPEEVEIDISSRHGASLLPPRDFCESVPVHSVTAATACSKCRSTSRFIRTVLSPHR